MISYAHIDLRPRNWRQSISQSNDSGVDQRQLRATCTPEPRCELRLEHGAMLRDYEFPLSILSGELPADDRAAKQQLQKEALGGLWFIEEHDFVHGWLYLAPNNFGAVWDQVRSGGYTHCEISLTVEPVQDDTWDGKPLSIMEASFSFTRRPGEATQREEPVARRWFRRG